MKTRFLRNALILCLITLLTCCIVACDNNESVSTEPPATSDNTPTTPVCAHEVSEWVIDKAATCTVEGQKHKECTSCKASLETAAIATTDHTETLVAGKPATCSQKGLTDGKKCSVCDKVLVEQTEIAMLKHTEQIVPSVSPTCSQKGLSEGKICSVCKTEIVKQTEIPTISHTETVVTGKQPTCTETGLTDGKKCSVCNAVILAQQTINALEHNESDWIIDTHASVGVAGSKHTECTRCSQTIKTETIPALEETHVHAGSQWVVVKEPTCKDFGTKNYICECGQVMDTDNVAKVAHTPKTVLGYGATCSVEGRTDGKVCSVCGETVEAQQPIPTIPHTEQTILGTSATCTSTGLTDGKKCSVCGKILVKQSATAKVAHTEETVLGKEATCTEGGTTDGKKCSVCTTITVSQLPTPPLGHSFSAGTCTRCGIGEPYGLWIVDGQGNPMTDIFVTVMKDSQEVKKYAYKGEFLSMTGLEAATYQLVLDLSLLPDTYTYDQALCVLTPETRTSTIRLFKSNMNKTSIFVGEPIAKDYDAYEIGLGSYTVPLTPNDYSFFIFTPDASAIYTITYECSETLSVSYHGSTFFVQGVDLSQTSTELGKYGNGLFVNVYASNIGGSYVFAVKSTAATSCVLSIKNAGDPGTRLEDEPWIPYLEDTSKVSEHLAVSKNGTYNLVDLTDLTLKAVFNENDGFYHLNSAEGPIIFIDLTSDCPYISSIFAICSNQRMGTYIYDKNGNVVEKRSYNELFIQYGMPSEEGATVTDPVRVPLTAKLAEAIQAFGNNNRWWAEGADTNIFSKVLLGAPYNQAFAWLLYCGYYS